MTKDILFILIILAFGVFGLGVAAGQILERRALERMLADKVARRFAPFADYPDR